MAKLDYINQDGTTIPIGSNAANVDYSGDVAGATNVKDAIDALASGYDGTDYSSYGVIGTNYPEELSMIVNVLDKGKWTRPRLRFLHTSDNHGGAMGNMETLVDKIKANFMVNTGDLVYDYFSNPYTTTLQKLTAPTKKPSYITIGNHDVAGTGTNANGGYIDDGTTWTYEYDQATANQLRYNKFFADLKTHNEGVTDQPDAGGIVANKTYYYVDYTTEKVRCIFIDQYDNKCTGTAGNYCLGFMSSTQIVWFINLLQEAATNGLHVVVFLHELPFVLTNGSDLWYDYNNTNDIASGTVALANIVEAFRTGGTYTYNGTEYTFTQGGFIGWFAGHSHHDILGWGTSFPKQFGIHVCCPGSVASDNNKTCRSYKLGVAFNYVVIDTTWRWVSIYRVGTQETYGGTKRDVFTYFY